MPRKKISNRYKILKQKKLIKGYYLIDLLINKILKKGKKTIAKTHIRNIINYLKKKSDFSFLIILEKAIKNLIPKFKITSMNNGVDQKVIELSLFESTKIALSWLIKGAKMRKMSKFSNSLSIELLEAFKGKGNAMKFRLNLYQQVKLLKFN